MITPDFVILNTSKPVCQNCLNVTILPVFKIKMCELITNYYIEIEMVRYFTQSPEAYQK